MIRQLLKQQHKSSETLTIEQSYEIELVSLLTGNSARHVWPRILLCGSERLTNRKDLMTL